MNTPSLSNYRMYTLNTSNEPAREKPDELVMCFFFNRETTT